MVSPTKDQECQVKYCTKWARQTLDEPVYGRVCEQHYVDIMHFPQFWRVEQARKGNRYLDEIVFVHEPSPS